MSGRFAKQAARVGRICVLSVMALLCVVLPAHGVTVSGLHSVEVDVGGSGPEDMKKAYADGLRRVILRVSGTSEVLEKESVVALLEDAESYLQSYQFLGAEDEEDSDRLRMTFGAVGINRALSAANAPVWGANRPLTMAWIAVEERGSRQLVVAPEDGSPGDGVADAEAGYEPEASGNNPWQLAFQDAAAERGLPLRLPDARFEDNRELLSDVWGQFSSRLEQASDSGNYDLLAIVRVNRLGDQWRAAWTFEGRGVEDRETGLVADTPEELARAVVSRWGDLLASRYAVAAGEVGEAPQLDMVISNVTSLDDYARINRILSDLAPVQQVGAARVTRERLTLRISFNGELEQLKEYVALDPRFIPESGSAKAQESASGPEPSTETEPEEGDSTSRSGPREAVVDPLFRYQPLLGEQEDSERAFESLYQILHYRWQPSPGVLPAEGDGAR